MKRRYQWSLHGLVMVKSETNSTQQEGWKNAVCGKDYLLWGLGQACSRAVGSRILWMTGETGSSRFQGDIEGRKKMPGQWPKPHSLREGRAGEEAKLRGSVLDQPSRTQQEGQAHREEPWGCDTWLQWQARVGGLDPVQESGSWDWDIKTHKTYVFLGPVYSTRLTGWVLKMLIGISECEVTATCSENSLKVQVVTSGTLKKAK
jgi:hypothetical protein